MRVMFKCQQTTQKRIKHYQNEMYSCKAVLKWLFDLWCKKKIVEKRVTLLPQMDFTMYLAVSWLLTS